MLAGALTAGASASLVQFSVGGVPVGAGEVIEVEPSNMLTVGVWIVPDAPIENFWVDLMATGPWDPFTDLVVDPYPWQPWDNDDFIWLPPEPPDFWPPSIGGFLRLDPWAGPGVVAEFVVHIPDVPESTILNLEYDYVEVGTGGADVLPLVLHVTPEPVSLGLLALGGVLAQRRRMT
jgi:hypothetical protein